MGGDADTLTFEGLSVGKSVGSFVGLFVGCFNEK